MNNLNKKKNLIYYSIDDIKQIDVQEAVDVKESLNDVVVHTRLSRNVLKEGSNIHCELTIPGTDYLKTREISYSSK